MADTQSQNTQGAPLSTLGMKCVKLGIVTEAQLRGMEHRSGGDEMVLQKIIVREGFCNNEEMGRIYADVHNIEFVNLQQEYVDEDLIAALSLPFAQKYSISPFRHRKNDPICIATSASGTSRAQRMLQKKYGRNIGTSYAVQSDIMSALASHDGQYKDTTLKILSKHQKENGIQDLEDSTVIDLVDQIIIHGIRKQASDIHIEPTVRESVVRERIDGILHRQITVSKDIHNQIVLRIKVLSNLATDEHSTPQDGKIVYQTPDGKKADIRVSIAPTTHGEKIVLRLLVAEDSAIRLTDVGLSKTHLSILQDAAARSWGMILVTGPTGAGKTSTLYAALRSVNTEDVNIATIEDPAEYDIEGINQMQVNEKAELTFATGLRSIVRQDPDIILVGEIRDSETANIAINAAMTGHLVMSTLHTNDAATAIPRLRDMGIEPFLISSTVNVIVAQRLVRTLCIRCRQSKNVTLKEMKDSVPSDILKKLFQKNKALRIFEGTGCSACNNSGFKGRTGVFEILVIDEKIHQLIMKDADADEIVKAAVSGGMTTMMDDAIRKVREGVTTIDEVIRVLQS